MPFVINGTEALVSNGESYMFIQKHRSTFYSEASIWTIPMIEEYNLCDDAIKKGYLKDSEIAFNMKKDGTNFLCLGKNKKGMKLFIGKFVNSSSIIWHGYPADYISNNQDKPDKQILEEMVAHNLIDARDRRRICRGLKL